MAVKLIELVKVVSRNVSSVSCQQLLLFSTTSVQNRLCDLIHVKHSGNISLHCVISSS